MHARTSEIAIFRSENDTYQALLDVVAIEAPLEMYVTTENSSHEAEPFSITMRTPGHDRDLITGLLFSEGVITNFEQIHHIEDNVVYKTPSGVGHAVNVWLKKEVHYDASLIKRNVVTTSSCGFCGRISMPTPIPSPAETTPYIIEPEVLYSLPKALREAQTLYKHTGSIHAAALFNQRGLLLNLSEDVGRHNAMDKLVGRALIRGELPFSDSILCYSGRVSYELVQKAIMTQVPVIASIGAPSSLAIEIARLYNITLVGFLRSNRFNVYHQQTRVDDN